MASPACESVKTTTLVPADYLYSSVDPTSAWRSDCNARSNDDRCGSDCERDQLPDPPARGPQRGPEKLASRYADPSTGKRQQLQWFWPEGVGGDRRAKKGKQAVNALIGIAVACPATRCDIF